MGRSGVWTQAVWFWSLTLTHHLLFYFFTPFLGIAYPHSLPRDFDVHPDRLEGIFSSPPLHHLLWDLALPLDLANEILVAVVQAETLNMLVWFSLESCLSATCHDKNMPWEVLLCVVDLTPVCSLKLNWATEYSTAYLWIPRWEINADLGVVTQHYHSNSWPVTMGSTKSFSFSLFPLPLFLSRTY